jgi:hypothetical protein
LGRKVLVRVEKAQRGRRGGVRKKKRRGGKKREAQVSSSLDSFGFGDA